MQRVKFFLGLIAIIAAGCAVFFVLRSELALVVHPKGVIAQRELELIKTNIFLMLLIVVPFLICFFIIAWKYRANNTQAPYEPERTAGVWKEIALWVIPSLIIVVMAGITWKATHRLDPYLPLESDMEPVKIQVVALDWKWLFIYPELGIATVNFMQFPANTPVNLELSADGSPMNSFWIPQLSGMIYSMTGMITKLHIMADEVGVFSGRASEINGEGLADMTFVAQASSRSDFESWLARVKQSPLQLTLEIYEELLKPSIKHPVVLYSYVEKELFNRITMKHMHLETP